MGGAGGCDGAPLGFGTLGAGTVRILVGALVAFVLVIVVSLVGFWQTGCPKGGFQCNDGKCLPRSRWCNREADCTDREDELEEECLLRQRTSHRDAIFPNFTITSCHLCVCPSHSRLEECLLPSSFNRGIVLCNVSSLEDRLNTYSQLPRRKIRSSDSYEMSVKVNRLIKAQGARLKRKEDDVDRGKLTVSDWKEKDSKFSTNEGAYQQSISFPEKADGIHVNISHWLEMKFFLSNVNKLRLKEEQHSRSLPFFQHKCSITKDCKKGKDIKKSSKTLKYIPFRARKQKFKTQQLITREWYINQQKYSNFLLNRSQDRPPLDSAPLLELPGLKYPSMKSSFDSFNFHQRRQKCKRIKKGVLDDHLLLKEVAHHSHSYDVPSVEALFVNTQSASSSKNVWPNDPYTKTVEAHRMHRRRRRHLSTHNVEGILIISHIQDKVEAKQPDQERSGQQDNVNVTFKTYEEDNSTLSYDDIITTGLHGEVKDHKDVDPGYQGNVTHNKIMILDQQTQDTEPHNVQDIDMGKYTQRNADYNHEEVTEQLENYCYCELSTQLKCPHTSLTHVPRNIVGDITLLNIKRSDIFALDAGVISQYNALITLSLEKNLLVSLPHGVFLNQTSLKNLYLSKNFIQEIHHNSFLGLTNLLRLFLDRNRLAYIDLACFLHTPMLEELNLAHNQLMLENQSFPHLPYLTNLYLNNNSLSIISEELLTNLSSVRKLELQDNRITVVSPRAFHSLGNLQSLIMSGNLLTSVKDLFHGLHSLYLLNLEELELRDIDEEHFNFLSKLKIVSVNFP